MSEVHTLPHAVRPPEQVMPHLLAAHFAAPPVGAGHAIAQAPQLPTSLVVSTQVLPHLVNAPLHVKPQALTAHVAVPLSGAPHALPQLPQLLGSLVGSTHAPPQLVVLEGHEVTHTPPEHA